MQILKLEVQSIFYHQVEHCRAVTTTIHSAAMMSLTLWQAVWQKQILSVSSDIYSIISNCYYITKKIKYKLLV